MPNKTAQFTLDMIAQTLYDKKGFNMLALDVKKVSMLTDFVLIAEGNVDRHVIALAGAVLEALNEIGQRAIHVEGLRSGDWVVIDCLNIMVHIFMPGMRDKYMLEQLWSAGEIVDLNINIQSKTKAIGDISQSCFSINAIS